MDESGQKRVEIAPAAASTISPTSAQPATASFWRSVEEVAAAVAPETAGVSQESEAGLSRRAFLQLTSASLALAGLGACQTSPPNQKIVPYRDDPPGVTPGDPVFYATAMPFDGYATGVVVESHEGRPTKIEGNPAHPTSLGATTALTQASILTLYDPHRGNRLLHRGFPASFVELQRRLEAWLASSARERQGDGLALLLEPTSSPLTASLVRELRDRYPRARLAFDAPFAPRQRWQGTRLATGRVLDTTLRVDAAAVIVALDSDFLAQGPGCVASAHGFASRRTPNAAGGMNRLYVLETSYTPTGASADHRWAVKGSLVEAAAAALVRAVVAQAGVGGAASELATALAPVAARARDLGFIDAVARDLVAHRGAGLVIVGERQPPLVHALGLALNELLGNTGQTLQLVPSVIVEAGEQSFDERPFVEALAGGAVQQLVIAGGDPAYSMPVDRGFAAAMARAEERIYLGLYENETSRASTWYLPRAYYLESWGDTAAIDGTVSIIQPLIKPLFGGRTVDQLLTLILGRGEADAHTLVTDFWRGRLSAAAAAAGFDVFWETALRQGIVAETGAAAVSVPVAWPNLASAAAARGREPRAQAEEALELALTPSAEVWDGSFANNVWLLEKPEALTKVMWDNPALVSPSTAKALGVDTSDVVRLHVGTRLLELPVAVAPGHADGAVTVALGYGRDLAGGGFAGHVGFDGYLLRTSDAPYFAPGASMEKTEERNELAISQVEGSLLGRPIYLVASLAEYQKGGNPAAQHQKHEESFHNRPPGGVEQWGMTIDLSKCTGCGACVIACQAENNIPVVGKGNAKKRREMHWLRIDRYFSGPPERPRALMQPMLCQHCEKAPCEYVCPVHATVHSPDGLNEMIYNRCVGTRFCSNNCPYKVRRFNWFNFNRYVTETEQMHMNPEVTVRARGVMEKCTYCVQRIRNTGIRARVAGSPRREGELMMACQQACPTGAIVFGDLMQPDADVTRLHNDPRAYEVLHDVGTAPHTRYLVRILNLNPELESA